MRILKRHLSDVVYRQMIRDLESERLYGQMRSMTGSSGLMARLLIAWRCSACRPCPLGCLT
jgi:hypothetical protein